MDTSVNGFKGLNNVVDPMRLDLSWLIQADNVNITQTNSLVRARGFTQKSTHYATTGAYATKDLQRLYVVDAGELRAIRSDYTHTVLRAGLSSAKTYFTEVNGVVYYANGTDFGLIEPDHTVWTWGIPVPPPVPATLNTGPLPAGQYGICLTYTNERGVEGGNGEVTVVNAPGNSAITVPTPEKVGYTVNVYATQKDGSVFYLLKENASGGATYACGPNELGRELPFWLLDGPRGYLPEFWRGRMYLAEAFPDQDQTVIWRSLPLHFHHFNYGDDAIIVPGSVRMLHPLPDALLIGTERAIYAYTEDQITLLAPYGVVPGYHASAVDGQVYFWTLRGLARALPFQNLTQGQLSVPPGLHAGAMVLEQDGDRRYVVALQKGGEAYNPRMEDLPLAAVIGQVN